MQTISHPDAVTTAQAHGRHHPRHAQRGQGMTEYIIIVALIAVAAIAVYQFFGQTIRSQTSGIAQEISGKSASQAITNSQTAADAAVTEGTTKKGLDAYSNDNSRK
jgi:Flp pilus assembly pilin Flp